jgi:plasmid segregation protein ParM
MKEPILIAVDSGKYATKAMLKCKDKQAITIFRTKMQRVENREMELHSGSFLARYKQHYLLVGDTVSDNRSNHDLTKKLDLHKICIYTAIAELLRLANLKAEDVEIHLAVNAPISTYNDLSSKQAYKDFIENQGNQISFHLNNQEYNFQLTNITIAFEGMGVIYDEMEVTKDRNNTTTVIDIGGLNTTFCTFDKINPIFDSMVVSNLGISALKSKLAKLINERFGIAVAQNDLERILQNGYLSIAGEKNEESKQLIQQVKSDHFHEIIGFAKSRGNSFINMDLQFVGGGSYMLRDAIQKEFPHARIVVNPQFANLKSFIRILEVKHGL